MASTLPTSFYEFQLATASGGAIIRPTRMLEDIDGESSSHGKWDEFLSW